MEKGNLKKQYINGLCSGAPVVLGFIPVGIAYAIMARHAGFSALHTCLMSLTVFAGASQMMAVGMYAQGAGVIAMIAATFVLNLRHLIMSVCVNNRMRSEKTGIKLLTAFGITDETFAIFTTQNQKRCTAAYFLGLVTVAYSSWNVGTLIGAIASDFLPEIITASLGIALYAMFIGLLVPSLTKNLRLAVLAVFTALCNSILSRFVASSWSLIASTLIGAFIGAFFVETDENVKEESADE